ncbi:MAG: IS3 family transposase [Acinetobacter tjernbergiae]
MLSEINHNSYETREEVKTDITDYIELLYNQLRI